MNPVVAIAIKKTTRRKNCKMNYLETIDYLYTRLPMFHKTGKDAYKDNLSNILSLCRELGNPQKKFKSIHVAGTNGKGSASHMLAAIFQSAGYKTGLYTSPHLKDFRERIKIDGVMCNETFVIDFTEKLQARIEGISPSFFEVTVAMAFSYFAQNNVDIAIIETGLGGRLDSTNIINPELALITNVSYDHINILGNTLPQIAFEKAGIIKPGTSVVVGEKQPETQQVFEKEAASKNAALTFATDIYEITTLHQSLHSLQVDVCNLQTKETTGFLLDLNGRYQAMNLLNVLTCVHILRKTNWDISDEALLHGLANTKKITGLRGRWDVLQRHPLVIADVAHNEDGMKQLLHNLEHTTYARLHIVIGFVSDKDISKMLSMLPISARYYFTNAHLPRALPAKELLALAELRGLLGNAFDSVKDALQTAKNNAGDKDMILICGSVFVVADAL